MGWTKGFDPYANVWCKFCGAGNSIRGKRIVSRTEYFDVDDPESPDSSIDEIHEDLMGETHYTCTACGATSDDIDDLATISQHEAHGAFIAYNKGKTFQVARVSLGEEYDDIYYGDDPDGE